MNIARILNVVAVLALVLSAVWLYRIKYEATLHAEHAARLKRQIAQEVDAVAVLKAEWAFLARPDRVQAFAKQHLDLRPLVREQNVRLASLPERPAPVDEIGNKLEALGLMGADVSIAVEKEPASPAAKKPAPAPVKKSTIAVKPVSQLKPPAQRAAPPPQPMQIAPAPRSAGPLNLTDFFKKIGIVR